MRTLRCLGTQAHACYLAIANADGERARQRSAELGIPNRAVCGTMIARGASAICELDVLNQLAYPHVVGGSPCHPGNRFDQPSHHDCVRRQCLTHGVQFRPSPVACERKNGSTFGSTEAGRRIPLPWRVWMGMTAWVHTRLVSAAGQIIRRPLSAFKAAN